MGRKMILIIGGSYQGKTEYAKEHFEKSVKKTLTIPTWLNQAALEKGINFSQVLQEALLSKIQA